MTNSLWHHRRESIYLTHSHCRMTIAWIRRSYLRSYAALNSEVTHMWQWLASVCVDICVRKRECNEFGGHKGTHLDSSSPSPLRLPSERLKTSLSTHTHTHTHTISLCAFQNYTNTRFHQRSPPTPLNGQSEPNITQPEMSGLITEAGQSFEQSSTVFPHTQDTACLGDLYTEQGNVADRQKLTIISEGCITFQINGS